jgi:hypothetical protein
MIMHGFPKQLRPQPASGGARDNNASPLAALA